MRLSRFLLRLLFPRLHRKLRELEIAWLNVREAWQISDPSQRQEIMQGLLDSDWVEVASGDDAEGDRTASKNPTQCPCGIDWDVEAKSLYKNQMPNQNDINNLYTQVKEPKLGACDSPCQPVVTFKGKWWVIRRHKKTGQFWLWCSKRVQWHCEVTSGPGPMTAAVSRRA